MPDCAGNAVKYLILNIAFIFDTIRINKYYILLKKEFIMDANLSEKFEIVTKLSTGKFKLLYNQSIKIILHTGKIIILTNDDKADIEEAQKAIYEKSVKTLYAFWVSDENNGCSMYDIIKKYQKCINYIVPSQIVFKYYYSECPDFIINEDYGRTWIDYEKQLQSSNYINDIPNGCGIWTADESVFPKMICSESVNFYGTNLMVLKTCLFHKYIKSISGEIIGSKYKVIYNGPINEVNTWLNVKERLTENTISQIRTDYIKNAGYDDVVFAIKEAFNI